MKIKVAVLTKVLTLLLLATSLPGCFPIIAGSGLYGALVIADRRPISIATIDRGIQLELESKMQQNVGQNSHINVNVFNQKVLLTGEVSNQQIKNRLNELAQQPRNVTKVYDELQIRENSNAESRFLDSSLFTLIKTKFIATKEIPSNSMKVVVEAQKVYLMGITTDFEARAAASVASNSSNSVKEVIKLLDIISEVEKKKLDNAGVPEAKK